MISFIKPNKNKVITTLVLILFSICINASDALVYHFENKHYAEEIKNVNPELSAQMKAVSKELDSNPITSHKLAIIGKKFQVTRIWSSLLSILILSYLFACLIIKISTNTSKQRE